MLSFLRRFLAGLASPQRDAEPFLGVRYFPGSWQQVLGEAKRQNKPVFLDFYTMGFYPREQLAQQVTFDSSFAKTFNAFFINYLIDARDGEGYQIAKNYRMHQSAVPTALFVLGDGSPVHRAEGYQGLEGLLAAAEKAHAAAREPSRLSMLEQKYVAGQRDPAFLSAYLQERSRWKMPNQEALLAYLSLVPQTEWTTDDIIPLMMGNLITYQPGAVNALMQRLRQGSNAPVSSLHRQISDHIRELIRAQFHQAIIGEHEQQVEAVIAHSEQLLRAERGEQITDEEINTMAKGYYRRFYADTKNFERYRPLAEAEAWRLMTIPVASVRQKDKLAYQRFLDREKELEAGGQKRDFIQYAHAMSTMESRDMAQRLNRMVQYYADQMSERDDLQQALSWSARCLEYDSCGGYLHLHARLLIKLGRPQEADEVLSQMSAEQTPGVHRNYMISKLPEDYEW